MAAKLSSPSNNTKRYSRKLSNSTERKKRNLKVKKIRSPWRSRIRMMTTTRKNKRKEIPAQPTSPTRYLSTRSPPIITMLSTEEEEDPKAPKTKRLFSRRPSSSKNCHHWISNSASTAAKEEKEGPKAARTKSKNTLIRSSMK